MTLLVMAAGMGSRYGGIKQIDAIGNFGELIIDYSCFDAIRAGFDRIVFVIRKEIEQDFREKFFDRFKKTVGGKVKVEYIFQSKPEWRKKPLGTADAMLAGMGVVNEPFCVINADDFYGHNAFKRVAKAKGNAVVAYDLGNTLSDFGAVMRGVIKTDEHGHIVDFIESSCSHDDIPHKYKLDTKVNMNFFAFEPEVLEHMAELKKEFLRELGDDQSKEFGLPQSVGRLIKDGKIKVKMLESADRWIGLTYANDKPLVISKIRELVESGVYPSPLWNGKDL